MNEGYPQQTPPNPNEQPNPAEQPPQPDAYSVPLGERVNEYRDRFNAAVGNFAMRRQIKAAERGAEAHESASDQAATDYENLRESPIAPSGTDRRASKRQLKARVKAEDAEYSAKKTAAVYGASTGRGKTHHTKSMIERRRTARQANNELDPDEAYRLHNRAKHVSHIKPPHGSGPTWSDGSKTRAVTPLGSQNARGMGVNPLYESSSATPGSTPNTPPVHPDTYVRRATRARERATNAANDHFDNAAVRAEQLRTEQLAKLSNRHDKHLDEADSKAQKARELADKLQQRKAEAEFRQAWYDAHKEKAAREKAAAKQAPSTPKPPTPPNPVGGRHRK